MAKEQLLSPAEGNRLVEPHADMEKVASLSNDIEKRIATLLEYRMAEMQKAVEDANAAGATDATIAIGTTTTASSCAIALAFILARNIRRLSEVIGLLRAAPVAEVARKIDSNTTEEVKQNAQALGESMEAALDALDKKSRSEISRPGDATIH